VAARSFARPRGTDIQRRAVTLTSGLPTAAPARMGCHGQTTVHDDVEWDSWRPIFSHTAMLFIGVVVFALGVIIGPGLAVWVGLPS
jgi:hypothetical protein